MLDGGRIAVLGCIIGLVVALVLAAFVEPLLFHVQGRDPPLPSSPPVPRLPPMSMNLLPHPRTPRLTSPGERP